ncbi:MAG: hypothetical protein COZ29_02565 [Candidatus Moranbacteria bacterium CG_4_10_14_3_um_filter_45_9]|jgi:hypothetical protein|nr:MAG: hypothetical protein COZ29_02565 [Candidatus Moranbacteria bacterium CG_4_10_14_3_um_filter_45_9]
MVTVKLSANDLPDGGGIGHCHGFPGFKQPGWLDHRDPRQGEDLKKGAVKGNQVFFYQLVTGNEIVFYRETEQGADLVIVIIGKSLAIGRKQQEKVQE